MVCSLFLIRYSFTDFSFLALFSLFAHTLTRTHCAHLSPLSLSSFLYTHSLIVSISLLSHSLLPFFSRIHVLSLSHTHTRTHSLTLLPFSILVTLQGLKRHRRQREQRVAGEAKVDFANKIVAVVPVEVPKMLLQAATAEAMHQVRPRHEDSSARRASLPIAPRPDLLSAPVTPKRFDRSLQLGSVDSDGDDDHVFLHDDGLDSGSALLTRSEPETNGHCSVPSQRHSSSSLTPLSPVPQQQQRRPSATELVPVRPGSALGELELRVDGGERRVNLRVPPDSSQILGLSVLGEPGRAAPVFISYIAPGGVADDNGGLRVGDRILSINGRSCEEITQGRAQELLAKASMRMVLVVRHEAVAFERYQSSERRLKPKVPPAPARLCVLARPGRVADAELDLGMSLVERSVGEQPVVFVAEVVPSAAAARGGIVRYDRVFAIGDMDTTVATLVAVQAALARTGRAVMLNVAYRPLEFAGRGDAASEELRKAKGTQPAMEGGVVFAAGAGNGTQGAHGSDRSQGASARNAQKTKPSVTPVSAVATSTTAVATSSASGTSGSTPEATAQSPAAYALEEPEQEDEEEDDVCRSQGGHDDGEEEEDEEDDDELEEEADYFDTEDKDFSVAQRAMHSRSQHRGRNTSTATHNSDGDDGDLGLMVRRIASGVRRDHDRHRSRLWSSNSQDDEFDDSGLAHARLPRTRLTSAAAAGATAGGVTAAALARRGTPLDGRASRGGGTADGRNEDSDGSTDVGLSAACPLAMQDHYPGAPKVHRAAVHEVSWDREDATYNPVRHTDRAVLHTRRADPNLTRNQRRRYDGQLEDVLHFNQLDGDVDRRSHEGRYDLGADGLPRNPHGRTGLRGRGLYNLWGPNHAVHVLISRWSRETVDGETRVRVEDGRPVLEVMVLNDADIGQQCLPSVFVRPGEEPASAIERAMEYARKGQAGTAPLTGGISGSSGTKSALGGTDTDRNTGPARKDSKDSNASDASLYGASPEEPLHAQAAQLVRQRIFRNEIANVQLHSGLLDDPRNTDNAWIETLAINYHDDAGLLNGIEFSDPSLPGTSPVQWMRATADTTLCTEQQQLLRELAAAHQAFYQRKRRRRQSNTAMLAVTLQRTSNDPFGFKLGTTAQGAHVVHSVNPGSLATGHLLPGDVVMEVNHVPVVGWSHQDVRALLRNHATLHLFVKRKRAAAQGGRRQQAAGAAPLVLPPATAAASSMVVDVDAEGSVIRQSHSPELGSSVGVTSTAGRHRKGRSRHHRRRRHGAGDPSELSTGTEPEIPTGRGTRQRRAEKAERLEVQLERRSLEATFGFAIGSDNSGVHEIIRVDPGTAAARLLHVGDAVAAINGVDLAGRSHAEVEDLCVDAVRIALALVRPPVASSKLSRRLKTMQHSTLGWMRHPILGHHGSHHHSHRGSQHQSDQHSSPADASREPAGVVGTSTVVQAHAPEATVPVVQGDVGRIDRDRHSLVTVQLSRRSGAGFGIECTHTANNQHIVTGCFGEDAAHKLQRGDHIVCLNGVRVPELTVTVMRALARHCNQITLELLRGCAPTSMAPEESKTLDLGMAEDNGLPHNALSLANTSDGEAVLSSNRALTTGKGASTPVQESSAELHAQWSREEAADHAVQSDHSATGPRTPVAAAHSGASFSETDRSRRQTPATAVSSARSSHSNVPFEVTLRRVNGSLGLRLQGKQDIESEELSVVVDQVVAPPASLSNVRVGQVLAAARRVGDLEWHELRRRTVEDVKALLSALGDHIELRLVQPAEGQTRDLSIHGSAMHAHPSVHVQVSEETSAEAPGNSGRRHSKPRWGRRRRVSTDEL